MKLTRKVATRAAVLVATGGVVLGMSATAFATPPYEPDNTNQLGGVLFYNSAGQLVTSGNINDDPNFAYAVATSDDPIATNTTATLFAYTPQLPGSLPTTWPGTQLTAATAFPVAAPANIAGLGAHRPVVTMDTTANGDVNFAGHIADKPNTNTVASGWANFYQLRIKTAGNTKWWAADILVDPSTGNWTLDYPNLSATTTSLATSPGTSQSETTIGAGAPSAVTLTATVTANQPGSVRFIDTDPNPDVQVGTTQTLPASATNTASVTIPAGLAVGVHHYEAVYDPPAGSLIGPSNGTATYTVNAAAADTTNTAAGASPLSGQVGQSFTFTADVTDTTAGHTSTVPQGTVQFRDNGVAIAGASGHTDAAGHVSVSGAFGFATGSHPITAQFTPDNSGLFNASTSSPAITVDVTPAPGDPCTNSGTPLPYPNDSRTDLCHDDQTFEVTVPRGNLFISTPYHPGHVFDLGTMRLSDDGTTLHASAPFGTASGVSPSTDGVTIIDTRSSGEGWSASVTSSDFTLVGTPGPTGDSSINACNLGFTGVTPDYVSGNAISATTKPISVAQNPNGGAPGVSASDTTCTSGLKGGPHQFASLATNGSGSVNVVGTMDLYAPTSTQAGLYRATVTFSIVSI